jgi:hypothetical protein
MLRKLSDERWSYYVGECLPGDRQILFKLTLNLPCGRWATLVEQFGLQPELSKNREIQKLLQASVDKKETEIVRRADALYKRQSVGVR